MTLSREHKVCTTFLIPVVSRKYSLVLKFSNVVNMENDIWVRIQFEKPTKIRIYFTKYNSPTLSNAWFAEHRSRQHLYS